MVCRNGLPPLTSDFEESWSWVAGAGIAVLAAMLSALGLNIQKARHNEDVIKKLRRDLPFARGIINSNFVWWVGFLFVTLASLVDGVALMFANQSTVAPVGATAVIWNFAFAHKINGEWPSLKMVGWSILVVLSSVLAILFSTHPVVMLCLDGMMEELGSVPSLLYFHLMAFASFFLWRKWKDWSSLVGGDEGGTWKERTRAEMQTASVPLILAAASIGSVCVTLTRTVFRLLRTWAQNSEPVPGEVRFWLILVDTLVVTAINVHWQDTALKYSRSVFYSPVFTGTWIILSAVGGMMTFGEWEEMVKTSYTLPLFMLGVVGNIVGLAGLSAHESVRVGGLEREGEEEEEEKKGLVGGGPSEV